MGNTNVATISGQVVVDNKGAKTTLHQTKQEMAKATLDMQKNANIKIDLGEYKRLNSVMVALQARSRDVRASMLGTTDSEKLKPLKAELANLADRMRLVKAQTEPTRKELERISKLKPASAGGGNVLASLAPIAAAGVAIVGAIRSASSFATELLNISRVTNLSTDTLQKLRYVSKSIGVDFNATANTASMLQRKLLGIENDSGMAAKALDRLGITVKGPNGQFRSMNDLFPEVIAKLQGMDNATERNALASQLFGRSLADIAPILAMTNAEYAKMSNKASLMSPDDIKQAEQFQRTLTQLEMAFAGVARKAGMEFIPMLKDDIVPMIQNTGIPAIKMFLGALKSLIAVMGSAPSVLPAVAAILGLTAATKTYGAVKTGLAPIIQASTSLHARLTTAKITGTTATATSTTATTANTAATKANAAALDVNISSTTAKSAADLKAQWAAQDAAAATATNTIATKEAAAANGIFGTSLQLGIAPAAALATVGVMALIDTIVRLRREVATAAQEALSYSPAQQEMVDKSQDQRLKRMDDKGLIAERRRRQEELADINRRIPYGESLSGSYVPGNLDYKQQTEVLKMRKKQVEATLEAINAERTRRSDSTKSGQLDANNADQVGNAAESAKQKIEEYKKALALKGDTSEVASLKYDLDNGSLKDADAESKKELLALAEQSSAQDKAREAVKAHGEQQKKLAEEAKKASEAMAEKYSDNLKKSIESVKRWASETASAMKSFSSEVLAEIKDSLQKQQAARDKANESAKSRYEKLGAMGAAGAAGILSASAFGSQKADNQQLDLSANNIRAAAQNVMDRKNLENQQINAVRGALYGNQINRMDAAANSELPQGGASIGEMIKLLTKMVENTGSQAKALNKLAGVKI